MEEHERERPGAAEDLQRVLAVGDTRSAILNTGLAASWGFCLGCAQAWKHLVEKSAPP